MKNLIDMLETKKQILSPALFKMLCDRNIKRLNKNITERGRKQSEIEDAFDIYDNEPESHIVEQWRDLETENQFDSKELNIFMDYRKEIIK